MDAPGDGEAAAPREPRALHPRSSRAGTAALAADTSAGREGLEFGILFFWRGAVGAKSLIN